MWHRSSAAKKSWKAGLRQTPVSPTTGEHGPKWTGPCLYFGSAGLADVQDKAWHCRDSFLWLLKEHLFFNSFISTRILLSASLQTNLRGAGCTKLGHLMKMMTTSVDNLRNSSNITSIRLINKVVEEVCAALPLHLRETAEDRTLCDQWSEECEYSFPSLSGGQLLSFDTPHLDVSRRIVHGAIAANRYRVHLGPEGGGMDFLFTAETLAHLSVQCLHLDILFESNLVSESWGVFLHLICLFFLAHDIMLRRSLSTHCWTLYVVLQVGYLADPQKLSSNFGLFGDGVGSERTAEGPNAYDKMMDTFFKLTLAVGQVLCSWGKTGNWIYVSETLMCCWCWFGCCCCCYWHPEESERVILEVAQKSRGGPG